MKRSEKQLDQVLATPDTDGRVHIIHNLHQRWTIAYTLHPRNAANGSVLHAKAAIAECSPEDQFNRKLGRMIAKGRLASGKGVIIIISNPDELRQVPLTAGYWRLLEEKIATHLLTGAQME